MAIRAEQHRLQYIRDHQKDFKIIEYAGLHDYLHKKTNITESELGTVIVLPSSFHGSPRYMAQRLQDALAIHNKLGSPDLFITFTCNPTHPDIVKCLAPGQTASDRPDIVARVFRQQQKEFMKDMKDIGIFGNVTGHIMI